ncbi:MAG TPA: glycosyltransferase family 1 protein [bacterium]|nr:glycosyltransferase family 1 protein [bacterium]
MSLAYTNQGSRSEKNIRWIYIAHTFGMPRTGGERYNHLLIETIQRTGQDVRILTDEAIPRFWRSHFILYNFWYCTHWRKFRGCRLIVDHYMFPRLVLFLYWLKKRTSVSVVGIVHHLYWNWFYSGPRFLSAFMKKAEACFIRRFNCLLVPSHCTLQSIADIVDPPPVAGIIPPGTDREFRGELTRGSTPKSDQCRLLYVGMLHRRKGIDALLRAMCLLPAAISLTAAGQGHRRYEKWLRRKVKRWSIEDRIRFKGHLNSQELDRLYRQADVFVLPSRHEGFGISLVEAMRAGLPVVASRICTLSELTDEGRSALLVPPGDVRRLADAICRLCADDDLRIRMGEAGRKRAQATLTWKQVESEFEAMIQKWKGMFL